MKFVRYIDMLILSTTSEEQTFSVIPRFEPTSSVTITLVSEQQNKQTHSFTYAATYLNGYLSITKAFSPVLVESNSYILTIKDGAELCFRGKIFVTDQTDRPQFTINEGVYTEAPATSNEYVII